MLNRFLQKLDDLAGIEDSGTIAKTLERTAFFFMFVMLAAAPHSIAATQIAGGIGLASWIARHLFKPFPKTRATFLAIPIIALYGWTAFGALFSYAPEISIPKLRGDILFFIFFFVFNMLRRRKAAVLAACVLIVSCMFNVLWMPVERIAGKGVRIESVKTESPLYKAGFRDGDGLFNANNKSISTPGDIVDEIEKAGVAEIRYYRDGHYWQFKVPKTSLLSGSDDLEKLGIGGWSRTRSWRSSGFYGHYTTYAEVLQLIGSLLFGLLIAGLSMKYLRKPDPESDSGRSTIETRLLLIFAVGLGFISLALLLTITRAAQAGFIVSVVTIVLTIGSRKLLVGALLAAIPIVIGGSVFLQQTRGVGFFDLNDASTTWRLRVYHEGLSIATTNPRNFLHGVGVDSIKNFADDWKLYDDGIVLGGHFHSTPIQLLVERGFPALLFWIWLFGAFLWTVFRALRRDQFKDWIERGVVLGAFGGIIGFLISSLVHYNYGDSEVVMVVYMIMAIGLVLAQPISGSILQASPAHRE